MKPGSVRTADEAVAFVDRVGVALVFSSDDLVLPSLWQAANGDAELSVFTTDEHGRRVLTAEMRRVWQLKNRLGAEARACVGKHVHGRLASISLRLLPARYALTGRSGRPDDFRETELGPLERELADVLLDAEPLTAPELRRLTGLDAKTTKRALERLQRLMVVTQAGEQEQDHGWDAAVFDLVARRYEKHLRHLPEPDEAHVQLARAVLRAAGMLSAADLAAVIGATRTEAAAALDRLADGRRVHRRNDAGLALWVGSGRR